MQPVRRLLAQAGWLGVVVLLRQPRQQLGGQLLMAAPALAVAQHMGPLAQGTPQAFQPGSGGRQREIPQQRIDPRQPQPRLQPGELPQQPRQQRRPFGLRQMAGQVPHQVGPGVGPLHLQLVQRPAADRRLGGVGVDAEAAGAGIAGVFVCGGEPAAEGGVVEARQELLGSVGGIIPAQAQQVVELLLQVEQPRLWPVQDRRQLAAGEGIALHAVQRQQLAHLVVGLVVGKAPLEGLEIEIVHAGGQRFEVGAIAQRQGFCCQLVEHEGGVEKLAAAQGSEPLGHLAGVQAGGGELGGQGRLLAAGLGVGLEVGQVAGFLGIERMEAEGLAQGLLHRRQRAGGGEQPQPAGETLGPLAQQAHDRDAGGFVVAGAVFQGLIEGIHHQQQRAGGRRHGLQGRQHALIKGADRVVVRGFEQLAQATGLLRLDRGAVGGQGSGQLGGDAAHKAPRRQRGDRIELAEVLGHHRDPGGLGVDEFSEKSRFAHPVFGLDQLGPWPSRRGAIRHRPGTHLLEQPGAAHEALAPEAAVGTEVEGLGPAPAQGTGDNCCLLRVGDDDFNLVATNFVAGHAVAEGEIAAGAHLVQQLVAVTSHRLPRRLHASPCSSSSLLAIVSGSDCVGMGITCGHGQSPRIKPLLRPTLPAPATSVPPTP